MRARFPKDESGQVLVITVLAMTVLLGFLAFAVDMGLLFHAKRNIQIAADAAAIAGALDYEINTSVTKAQAAGQAASTANGFTNGVNGVTVTINPPPVYGPEATKVGYVEAIVQQTNPTFFMGIVGPKTITVGARAVAGKGAPGPGCFYALGGSGIVGSGTGGISTPGCAIEDNGGIVMSGVENITASEIEIGGSYVNSGSGTASPAPVHTGTVTDPLASLTQPTVPGTCSTLSSPFPNPVPIGCYNSIVTSGSATLNLSPGLTIINGSIIASGSLNITGTGVTLFMTGGIIGAGNVGLNITAPTSGTYDGMALWLQRGDSTGLTLSGNSTTSFNGILYAPSIPPDLQRDYPFKHDR